MKVAILSFFIILSMTPTFANKNGKIYLIPIGKIDKIVLEYLKSGITDIFAQEVEIVQAKDLSVSAYNPKRKQYHSTQILQEIKDWSRTLEGGYNRILVIIDVDLYVPSLNFVFGEADINSGIALISLIRLRQGYYGLPEDSKLFYLRALKEAIHELGHTYGLGHCLNPECVMYFSNSLLDTDRKDFRFCPKCQKNFPSPKNA